MPPPNLPPPQYWRKSRLLLALLIWLLLSWLLAQQIVLTQGRHLLGEAQTALEQDAQKLRDSIALVIRQQHGIPRVTALHGEVIAALGNPAQANLPQLNRYLQAVARNMDVQVVYILDPQGNCIASSNYDQRDSFIGNNFRERAYFQDAWRGGFGTQYALGKVSNVPGLYFSAPVRRGPDIIGVAVVKLNLSNLLHFMGGMHAFVTDRYGVVILATNPKLLMQVLPEHRLAQLSQAQAKVRYKQTRFQVLRAAPWSTLPLPGAYQHPLTGDQPVIRSASYNVGNPDVTLHAYTTLPQLQQTARLEQAWFTLLALLGAIGVLTAAWRLSVLKNRDELARSLHENEARFRAMADSAPALIWISDVNNMGVWFNRSWLEYTGRSMEQELGVGWMFSIHPDDLSQLTLFNRAVQGSQHQRIEVEYRLRRADGQYGWVADTDTPYFDPHGNFQVYISYCWDINHRKHNEEQIRQLAFYDTLTRLPNRRLLDDRLSQLLADHRRDLRHAALLFLDLDNFKPLNDTHGHAAGDILLIEAAQRILACVRKVDTVARFGGDEFVVLLTGLNAERGEAHSEAGAIAEKIRHSLSQPYRLSYERDGQAQTVEHCCTSSIGVVLFQGNQLMQGDILRYADAAMYRAKELGRNQISFHRTSSD